VFEGAEHDIGDFVTSVRPDVDDLIVTLTVGDDALAILLFDGTDLFVSILELDLFLFRNNHVRNSNRDTGFGRFTEAKLLEFIKRLDRSFLARHLVATPDNVAQDRKSTRLNSSHVAISYAVFCLKKKKK